MPMTTPLVSVVVPTRNRAESLRAALMALARQEREMPHEIIVADNGSTDATRDIVEESRRSFPWPLRYVFEPRPGPSNARNAGIAKALAPVIAFTDDDVCVDPTWVTRIHELAARHPDIECFGGKTLPVWHASPASWLDRRHWSPLALTDHGDTPFTVSAASPKCLITANLGVRRRTFERVGGFSPEFPRAQDHEWMLRFWRAGGVGRYEPSLVAWADVPPDRMRRRYHRRWHFEHGRWSARMRLREQMDASGRLYPGALPAFRQWAGVPPFIIRGLLKESLLTLRLTATRAAPSETLAHLHMVYDLLGDIAERIDQWRGGKRRGLPHDAPPVPSHSAAGASPRSG
jgi:glycosyltransferase involved in cell wall biosynthesis